MHLHDRAGTLASIYIYIYIAIVHIIILINKVHVSTYCAWSYSLHAAVLQLLRTNVTICLHGHLQSDMARSYFVQGRYRLQYKHLHCKW